jgi:hypothetical protein
MSRLTGKTTVLFNFLTQKLNKIKFSTCRQGYPDDFHANLYFAKRTIATGQPLRKTPARLL